MAECNYCWCPKTACPNHGDCKACVLKHRAKGEVPSCFFGKVEERVADKSYENFCRHVQGERK